LLGEIRLVGVGHKDFASLDGQNLGCVILVHRNRLTRARSSLSLSPSNEGRSDDRAEVRVKVRAYSWRFRIGDGVGSQKRTGRRGLSRCCNLGRPLRDLVDRFA
jgi:hypothetical protein